MDTAENVSVDWRDVAVSIAGAVAVQRDRRFVDVSAGFASRLNASSDELDGEPWDTPFDRREADRLEREALAAVRETGTWRGTVRPATTDDRSPEVGVRLSATDRGGIVWTVPDDGVAVDPTAGGTPAGGNDAGRTAVDRYRVGIARDVSDRLDRERAIERQRDELATLDRINELLLDTVRELVQTGDRQAIERTVCERLAASDLYQFAWFGDPAFNDDRVVPWVTAGDDGGYVDAIIATTDGNRTSEGPAGRAIATGEIQVASVDDPSVAPWREAAREQGIRTVAAVPVQHEGTVFGVLVVYTGAERAFTARERDDFDVLGRTVGYAIHATRQHELLFADAVVELEFSVAEAESVLTAIADTIDCELVLDGCVSVDDAWVLYLSAEGAPPHSVIEAATADGRVSAATVVSETDTTGRVELVVGSSSIVHAVTEAGTTVRSASITPEDARLVVEAPVDADVRNVVEQVRDVFPGARLFARRERDREVDTGVRPAGLLDDLTDRQREVLLAAYHADYFEWPRGSAAEDLASSLDLASSTLLGHLRRAERSVFSAIIDRNGASVADGR